MIIMTTLLFLSNVSIIASTVCRCSAAIGAVEGIVVQSFFYSLQWYGLLHITDITAGTVHYDFCHVNHIQVQLFDFS